MSDDENSNDLTFSMPSSSLRTNGHIVLNGRPCKIVEMSTARPGKHGDAKIMFTGIDIFTGKKMQAVVPGSAKCDVPVVRRLEYGLIAVDDDGNLLLEDEDGSTKSDVRLSDGDLGQRIQEFVDAGDDAIVTIQSAMGEEACIAVKKK